MSDEKGFASDNYSGVHPEILDAIVRVNHGHISSYGNDAYTKKAISVFEEHFGKDIDVFFVFLGTGANVLGLKSITKSHHAVICADTAHINTDECGAPERFGPKLIYVPNRNGKVDIEDVKPFLNLKGVEHFIQPKVISITQSTEMGTVYSLDEIRKIADFAHENDMYLHMDGARLANAAVSLGVGLKETSKDVGVDVLSFGGTKNGMMYGEAVVFFNTELAKDFKYIRKQGMQLASKMRFISVQFEALLKNNLWQKNASHANKMAKLLVDGLKEVPGIEIVNKVEANAIFAILPQEIISELQKTFPFYVWDPDKSLVRWMTSFDTTEDEVKSFVESVKKSLKK